MVSTPCVVRSKLTFDTRAPSNLQRDELAYLYDVDERYDNRYGGVCTYLKLISLEWGRCYEIRLPSDKLEKWLDVVA